MVDKFKGTISALVTPFNKDFSLDLGAFKALIELQKEHKVQGILVAGSTGEAPTLSAEEKISLVQEARKIAGDELVVVAGAGSNCTASAILNQKAMQDAGSHATLHVTPYYNKPNQDGLLAHFSAIAKDALGPIILYNAPGRTGIDLAPTTSAKLAADFGNIIGIKDANDDAARFSDLVEKCANARKDFLVYSGEGLPLFPTLALGGQGIISVVAQIAGYEMNTLYQCYLQNDFAYGQKIGVRLNALMKFLFSHTNPIVPKIVLSHLGLVQKIWRLPLVGLKPEQEQELMTQTCAFNFVKSLQVLPRVP